MAVTLATGTGSATAVPAQTPLMPTLASFRLQSQTAQETVYVNSVGALDQPNKVRHAVAEVADVFKNTGVAPDTGQATQGLSILTQVTETWKVDDPANTSFASYYLPVSAHMVMKVPNDALITSTVLAAFYLRAVGSIWGAADDTLVEALEPLLHGVTLLR